ncbi:MAG: Gfo/Idh/MocA family oxidoreductase [Armatimonadetes bacterium]|nr:Gfo/Idh/MocA family oxidoreductase [Armatimonadota bacterium]MDE2206228.1 Gfo/Idh/MocA family oxidoreductase [Armatimonadota bacterium]
MTFRAAVVGAGQIGRSHLAAYQSCAEVELVAVCDLLRDRADAAAAEFGGKAYTSIAAMAAAERLDAVSVCTAGAQNGSHHFAPVMQCLECGWHVLCEKPLSNHLTEARTMVNHAAKLGLCLGTDLNHRFTPQAELARRWVAEGRLGAILMSNVTLWIDNPNDRSEWVHLRALHPHSLDVMRYFCGRAVKVQAFVNHGPRTDGEPGLRVCWSNCQVNVLFESGALGHLTGSYDANMKLNLERCEVLGDKGRFVIDNCFERLTFYPRHGEEITVVPNPLFGGMAGFEGTIERRVKRWCAQLAAGAKLDEVEGSGAEGLAVQEIIEGAIESWETGCVVDLENG